MECVDGVCRFVPKSQRQPQAANDENAPPQQQQQLQQAVQLPPVKVGDVPPMPLPLEPLMDGQLPAPTTLQALTSQGGGMVVVLDLWSTACVRCPEALTKLDGVAAQFAVEAAAGKVMFATVNIDDKAKGAVIVAENGWAHLRHLFISEATKEMLKARFGLASVPFCMVFDKEGRLTEMGNPKRVDLDAALSSLLGKAPPVAGSLQPQQALTLDEDF